MEDFQDILPRDSFVPDRRLGPGTAEKIHEALNKAWKCKPGVRHSVAPTPVQLTRESLEWFATEPYVVAEKTDGQRLLLFLTTAPGYPTAVFVDRKRGFTQVRCKAPASYYRLTGTLLDGELVGNKFIVFDVVASRGCFLHNRNYLARLQEAQKLIKGEADGEESAATLLAGAENFGIDGLKLSTKEVYLLSDFERLLKKLEGLDHPSDGLVYTPINCKIQMGSHPLILKYKEKPTADLTYLPGSDGSYTLHWNAAGEQDPSDTILRAPEGYSVVVSRMPPLPAHLRSASVVLEFAVRLNTDTKTFVLSFHKSREHEKQRPNHINTVKAIFKEVLEGITLNELGLVAMRTSDTVYPKPMESGQLRKREMGELNFMEERVAPKLKKKHPAVKKTKKEKKTTPSEKLREKEMGDLNFTEETVAPKPKKKKTAAEKTKPDSLKPKKRKRGARTPKPKEPKHGEGKGNGTLPNPKKAKCGSDEAKTVDSK